MRDEPTGRYAVKLEGRPLSARTYHLYKDCGHLYAKGSEDDVAEIIEPSDEIIGILEMRVCSLCRARSEEVPAEDLIAEIAGGAGAAEIMAALVKHNYIIKRQRKRGAK